MLSRCRAGRAAFVLVALVAAALLFASVAAALHDHTSRGAAGSHCVLCSAGPAASVDSASTPVVVAPAPAVVSTRLRSEPRPAAPTHGILRSRGPPASFAA